MGSVTGTLVKYDVPKCLSLRFWKLLSDMKTRSSVADRNGIGISRPGQFFRKS
jgi:hypothetical protein